MRSSLVASKPVLSVVPLATPIRPVLPTRCSPAAWTRVQVVVSERVQRIDNSVLAPTIVRLLILASLINLIALTKTVNQVST